MRARPKYQVFISSTFGDLREERQAVTWAILSARHIPAGMENFTATDDRGWQTIKSVIDRSDYYVLILAGRYGSIDTDGKSWTEKEYDYALSIGIPILGFLRSKRSITSDRAEDDPILASKLEMFKRNVRSKHLCLEWSSETELVGHVSNALRNHIVDDEDLGRNRPGWYRGNELPSAASLDEFARVSSENAVLRAELEAVRVSTSKTSHLLLVDRDGEPLSSTKVVQREFKAYSPALATFEQSTKATFGRDYLILNIIETVQLGIRNDGPTLIDQITIDLILNSIVGFYCGWDGDALSKSGGELDNSSIKDEYKHKYPRFIRIMDSNKIMIRIRVPSVPAGGIEYLPDLFVLGTAEKSSIYFDLSYKIVGNSGTPQLGDVRYTTIFEGTSEADENTARVDKRELEKRRGPIVLGDMLLK